jgi:Ca-activated chloride channel family protein
MIQRRIVLTSRGIIIGLAMAAGLAVPLAFHAQGPIEPRKKANPPAPQQDQKKQDEDRVNLRVESTLVLVPVEVSDNLNRPVSGLEKEDFKLFDDKVEQKIISFAMEDDPIAVGLVFDVSGSMGRDLFQTRTAAQRFFRTANKGDEFCLVTLASEAKVAVQLTENPGDIDNELLFAKGGGTTALLDGIYLAINEVRKSKKLRKALVIISDGGENSSRYTETEVLNATRESDVLIYSIGVFGTGQGSNYSDQSLLKNLSKETGGRMFPTEGLPIADFADKIITDLRNRYVLGYSPTNAARDGKFHRLEVKVPPIKGLPKLSVHWKTGYYAATD